jgi:hypothetical protein
MKREFFLFTVVWLSGSLLLAGCTGGTADKAPKAGSAEKGTTPLQEEEAQAQAALAKLGPEDRMSAEAQKWCAVHNKNLLGSMGVPYKVTIKGQPVFLCCDGCEKTALADPDKTLAKVEELRKAAASGGK